MSNLVPFSEVQAMAEVAAGSKMFGFKNPQEAMAIMLLCQAENMHPAVAMRDYHVIQGRPALKADAMLARFQQAGGSVSWKDYTDEKVTGVFSHPSGGTLEVSWTLARAKTIGIANKDNWKNYPRAMLRARVASEGIRSVYPGCVVGVYTPEEVQDFAPAPAKDMGMAEVVDVPETLEVEEGAFKLYIPNNPEPYAAFHTREDWVHGYVGMSARIHKSDKLPEEVKKEKLAALQEVNSDVLGKLDSLLKVKIRAGLVEAGVSLSPKPEPSQQGYPDTGHSEEIF